MNLPEVIQWIEARLQPNKYDDYCPNGVEVEGDGREIQHIALAVSLTQEVIDQAIQKQADLILTHHGLFWKGQPFVVTGANRMKLHSLLGAGTATASYHLPLDYHPVLGNNVQLAQKLGLENIRGDVFLEPHPTLVLGDLLDTSVSQFVEQVTALLDIKPRCALFGSTLIHKVAIATGAAQKFFDQARHAGADLFLTGEGSEQNYAQAQENQMHFIAAGHYQSEQFGIQALGQALSQELGLGCFFLGTKNPF